MYVGKELTATMQSNVSPFNQQVTLAGAGDWKRAVKPIKLYLSMGSFMRFMHCDVAVLYMELVCH